ncbi:hypothetical protein AAC387_Pa05g0395 [Persea americana]
MDDQVCYRNRKGWISQNVMCDVSFDMRFNYVLAGWEGSASNSRILQDAIYRRPLNRLKIPVGKYYLVDAGYANARGFLAPYRGVRYHLKEYSTNSPRTPKELYNLRHSKLRNVVERTFVVLKSRFPILKIGSHYPLKTQAKIVVATCVLHNFIRKWDGVDELFGENMDESLNYDDGELHGIDDEMLATPYASNLDKEFAADLRDNIAQQMWDER